MAVGTRGSSRERSQGSPCSSSLASARGDAQGAEPLQEKVQGSVSRSSQAGPAGGSGAGLGRAGCGPAAPRGRDSPRGWERVWDGTGTTESPWQGFPGSCSLPVPQQCQGLFVTAGCGDSPVRDGGSGSPGPHPGRLGRTGGCCHPGSAVTAETLPGQRWAPACSRRTGMPGSGGAG